MESFEQFVAVAMEAEGLIVSEAVKFPVQRKTRKLVHDEIRRAAASKTYRDNPVLVTMKVLDAAGLLVGVDTSGLGTE